MKYFLNLGILMLTLSAIANLNSADNDAGKQRLLDAQKKGNAFYCNGVLMGFEENNNLAVYYKEFFGEVEDDNDLAVYCDLLKGNERKDRLAGISKIKDELINKFPDRSEYINKVCMNLEHAIKTRKKTIKVEKSIIEARIKDNLKGASSRTAFISITPSQPNNTNKASEHKKNTD